MEKRNMDIFKNLQRIFSLCIVITLVFTNMPTVWAKNNNVKLTLNKKNTSVYEGKTIRLRVNGKIKKKDIVWYSSNKKVATVTSNGAVKGKKAGSAKIYVKRKSNKQKAFCKVNVVKHITKLEIASSENVILDVGEASQVKVNILPKKSTLSGVQYQSLDASIASVSNTGRITALSPGLTQIKVTSVGVNKKNKKLSSRIQVYVQEVKGNEQEHTIPNPNVLVTIDSDNPYVKNTDNGNHSNDGNNNNHTQTLQDLIKNIIPPTSNQPIAAQFLVEDAGDVSTLYFINKQFSSNFSITLNGKKFTNNTSAAEVLYDLEKSYAVRKNNSNTIRLSRIRGEEWWTITDLTINKNYLLRAWQNDAIYNSPYGLIITKGDTRSEIIIN